MEKIIKCKVLDIREFKKEGYYYYHIILKNLNTNKRISLRIEDYEMYFENLYFNVHNHNILIKDDIINMEINYDNKTIIFNVLEEESEA